MQNSFKTEQRLFKVTLQLPDVSDVTVTGNVFRMEGHWPFINFEPNVFRKREKTLCVMTM
jgi:hypothetical protein